MQPLEVFIGVKQPQAHQQLFPLSSRFRCACTPGLPAPVRSASSATGRSPSAPPIRFRGPLRIQSLVGGGRPGPRTRRDPLPGRATSVHALSRKGRDAVGLTLRARPSAVAARVIRSVARCAAGLPPSSCVGYRRHKTSSWIKVARMSRSARKTGPRPAGRRPEGSGALPRAREDPESSLGRLLKSP